MMILFLSPKSGLWKIVIGRRHVTQDDIYQVTNVTAQSLTNWRRGLPIGKSSEDGVLQATIIYLRDKSKATDDVKVKTEEIIAKFFEAYRRDWFSMQFCSEVLQLSIEMCQQIIEEAIYSNFPVFPYMYHPSEQGAKRRLESVFDYYQGFFYL